MAKRLLLSCSFFCLVSLSFAQTDLYRTIDGQYNNPNNRYLGAAHSALVRVSGNGFADGQSLPAGPNRPNPRTISNALFAQDGLLNDPVGLSDYTWVFGQFMDHDLGLTEEEGEPFNIRVPAGDPSFDPMFFGTVEIPMRRNAPRFGTGSGAGNPRQYNNEITAYIDGSGVYGSDDARANWLRSFTDGKMKVSTGNMLPYNTVDGERASPLDPLAPHMADAVGQSPRLFVAGDVRANENPLLLSFHTLFVREHNRQCDLLKAANPDWDDEQLYQHARKIVGGLIQSITYDEWLPAMGVDIPAYAGYQSNVNPQLSNVFSAAAFRVGHTLLNGNIRRLDATGQVVEEGNLSLRQAFFNLEPVRETGLDPFFRGMAEQIQQKMDNRIVDDVRNFLFGPPGAGGLDLAAININRGRDRGLPSYNKIRQAYGLPINFGFDQINPDPEVYQALSSVYSDDINEIDPWVAMLAERPMDGSIFGQTIQRVMEKQFADLRDGDRFFYQNDPLLSDTEKDWITNTTFREVVMYNSGVSLMQENVFEAMPFSEICGAETVAVDGVVKVHTTDAALPGVTINVMDELGTIGESTGTSELGFFDFTALPACQGTILSPSRNDSWNDGINILDMVAVQRDLLGIEPLANPYQYLAGDANGDGNMDVLDIIAMARIILELDTELQPAPTLPWGFVAAAYEFEDPTWPFLETDLMEDIDFSEVSPTAVNQGFIAYKRGDVNADADLTPTDMRPGLFVSVPERAVPAGAIERVELTLSGTEVAGYQLGLTGQGARILNVVSTDLPPHAYTLADGELQLLGLESGQAEHTITVTLQTEVPGALSERIGLAPTTSVSIDLAGRKRSIQVGAAAGAEQVVKSKVFPNPFLDAFQLEFETPLVATTELSLQDATGRTVHQATLAPGTERLQQQGLNLPAGAYFLQLRNVAGELLLAQPLVRR